MISYSSKPKHMSKIKTIGLLLFITFLNNCINAQDKPNVKFEKITAADFDLSKYSFDTSAAAVVIADIGECHYEGTDIRGLRLIFTHYKRVKILNKSAFDAATVIIPFDSRGNNGQRLTDVRANTYNIENGQIVTAKLDDKSVFTENYTKGILLKKFSLPGVKEGSIIEYSYTLQSTIMLDLQPWEFQGKYPCLWSEYNVSFPEVFKYVTLEQGYNPYFINTTDQGRDFGFITTRHHWVIKDVPPLNEEKFTTTVNNYISKIEFQLSSIEGNGYSRKVLSNWSDISDNLMKSDNFGADLLKNNKWLEDGLKPIINNTKNKLEKAEKIFMYVRDNFKCTQNGGVNSNDPLKTIFTNKSGNVAEINLLLCAMLNHENIQSEPMILSRRQHGFANGFYPLLSRYDYVICDAMIDDNIYFLDASQEFSSFGFLPEYCYNGPARIIDKDNSRTISFVADSLMEKKQVSVFISNDEKKPNDITGSFQSQYGYYESYNLREKLSKTSTKDFFKELKSQFNDETEIQNIGIDSLKELDKPVTLHCDFSFKNVANADIIYFNPIMSPLFKENPLKSANRKYPVEMPYATDEVYVLNMDIPLGYTIDEIPNSERVRLNNDEGFFEYVVDKDETSIQLRSRVKLSKATFNPEEYEALRNFFAYVLKKQSEQIVFKKKK